MKYLCINGYFSKSIPYVKQYPQTGIIYTLDFKRTEPNGKVGLVLKELKNNYFFSPKWGEMVLPSFDENRFILLEDELLETDKVEELELTIS